MIRYYDKIGGGRDGKRNTFSMDRSVWAKSCLMSLSVKWSGILRGISWFLFFCLIREVSQTLISSSFRRCCLVRVVKVVALGNLWESGRFQVENRPDDLHVTSSWLDEFVSEWQDLFGIQLALNSDGWCSRSPLSWLRKFNLNSSWITH